MQVSDLTAAEIGMAHSCHPCGVCSCQHAHAAYIHNCLCCAAEKSMKIAADACIYTNHIFTTEQIPDAQAGQAG